MQTVVVWCRTARAPFRRFAGLGSLAVPADSFTLWLMLWQTLKRAGMWPARLAVLHPCRACPGGTTPLWLRQACFGKGRRDVPQILCRSLLRGTGRGGACLAEAVRKPAGLS